MGDENDVFVRKTMSFMVVKVQIRKRVYRHIDIFWVCRILDAIIFVLVSYVNLMGCSFSEIGEASSWLNKSTQEWDG